MIPVEVTLSNFLGYDDNAGAGYCYHFRDHRLWSISGDNGAGKSAIFDAITYLLFGRHRGGQSRDEELLHKGAAEMKCSFSFEHFSRLYRITRTLKKRTKRTGTEAYEKACQLDWYDPSADAWREVPGTSTVTALEEHVANVLLGFDYDTFISSVLLLQGESDKLIRAAAKDRFNYLSGILDLRQYRLLEDRANQKARTLRSQHDILASTLGEIGIPSAEEVERATIKAADAETARTNAAGRLQEAHARHERVVQYEGLVKRQSHLATKAAEQAEAQAHAAEIRADAQTKRVLSNVLPRLRDTRAALDKAQLADGEASKASAAAAAIDLDTLDVKAKEAEQAHSAAKSACEGKVGELRERREERRHLETELAPARRLQELDRSLAEAKEKIATLTARTAELPSLRRRRNRLEALHRCGLLIRAYTEARQQEAAALGSEEEQQIRVAVTEAAAALEEATAQLAPSRESIGVRQGAVGKLKGELAVAQQNLHEREQAGSEGTCSRCGQPVTAEHIKIEMAKCKAEIKRIEAGLREEEQLLADEKKALDAAERGLPALEQARKQAQSRLEDLEKARARLVELDEDDLTPDLPADCRQLLTGPFGAIDQGLVKLRQELNQRADVIKQCEQLAGMEADLRSQEGLVKTWGDDREILLKKISTERASEVVKAAQELDEQLARLEAEEQDFSKALETAATALDLARRERQEAANKRSELQAKAQLQATAADGYRAAATAAARGAAEEFLPASKDKIAEVEKRLEQLSGAEERLALVDSAERELTGLRGQLREVDEAIAKVAGGDRIPAGDAAAEEEAAKHAVDLAESAARQDRQVAVELAKIREERLAMQQQAEQLSRSHQVWARLAKLLGRGGIQLALLKRDLAEIEKLANVLLAKISGGNLRLQIECLRGRTGEEIVFRCIDGASADQALDVAFLSGGQKFRVAVALAAGIGQYAGLGGSMPSQIIDEGFGSLDSSGRQEMLDAIREMSEHFERVIVVSHTESFHDPSLFPARYELRKDGRRTLVTASV